MAWQQAPTTAQPTATLESLRAQIEATQLNLNDALARRAGIIARIDAAGGPSERVRLRNGELRGVDGQIGRFEAQLAGLRAELQQREAFATTPAVQPVLPEPVVPPTATTTVPPVAGMDPDVVVIGGIAALVVLVPLLIAIAARAGRRAALAARRPELEEVGVRLTRMEEAITTISLEVERVEESQRFLTSALVANGMNTPVREEVGTRR